MGTVTKQQKKVPELRFPEFKGDWREFKLGELGRVAMCKRVLKHQTHASGDIPFYTIGTFGKIAGSYINQSLYDEFRAKYPYPKKGDILISAAGTIGRVVVYDGNPAYFQDSNIVWIDNDQKAVTNEFLLYCYRNIKWKTEDTTIARLYNDNLKNTKSSAPLLPEQQKIADFLGSVDAWLDNLRQQKTALETYKRGMMQKLFTQQVRFKDENGKQFPGWKTSKVSSLFEYLRTNSFSGKDLNYQAGNIYNLHYGDIHTTFSSHFNMDDQRVPYVNAGMSDGGYPIENGDVIIADASEDYKDIGKGMEVMNISGKYIVAGLHTIALRKITDVFVAGYMGHYLKSQQYRLQVMKVAQGAKVLGLSKKYFSQIVISYPVKDEQRKIADFLTSIDQTITAKAEEITKVEQWKKGLMQKMFV